VYHSTYSEADHSPQLVYILLKSLQGFYKDDSCRYVNEGTGQTLYSFTVRLNACGTQFIDQFQEGGQAFLENVLVIQNEPGIQEVCYNLRYCFLTK
jgi:hypothetical protein